MERRRRALGLKKSCDALEKNDVKSSRRMSSAFKSSKSSSEDQTLAQGKTSQKSQPNGSVTPKQKTQLSHSNVTPLKPESPRSPLLSPGSQMIFPMTIASPEIEVSWDWSCSQVPKDMLPPKRTKPLQETRAQLPVARSNNTRLRPRPPLHRQISEEENQKRLEYYKNILALRPSEGSPNTLYDSTNNNLEDVSVDATTLYNTPKRPTTRLSSASKKKYENNSLFDDSANEFMIECSQAIEEKLKNGEIDMGPIVDIEISQSKRLHSPGIDSANLHKKTCNGRVNLFPENFIRNDTCSEDKVINNDNIDSKVVLNNNTHSNFVVKKTGQDCLENCRDEFENTSLSNANVSNLFVGKTRLSQHSLKTNQNVENIHNNNLNRNNSTKRTSNTNCDSLERRLVFEKPAQSSSKQPVTKYTVSPQNRFVERLQKSVNSSNESTVHNSSISQSGNNTLYKGNQSSFQTQNQSNNIIRNQKDVTRSENCKIVLEQKNQELSTISTKQEQSRTSDITSLLDDDFDLELSCLDVDSLCKNSGNQEPMSKHVTTSAPKLCTQQEIEAKRLAALKKLMMKKKKR